jgi:HEAT repeat protein
MVVGIPGLPVPAISAVDEAIPIVPPLDDQPTRVVSPVAAKSRSSGGLIAAVVLILGGMVALFCCGGGSGLAYWLLFGAKSSGIVEEQSLSPAVSESPGMTRRGSAKTVSSADEQQPPAYWISVLRAGPNPRAKVAREQLTQMGIKAVPDLRKAARDSDTKLRLAAVSILGAIGENAVNAWNDIAVSLNDPDAGLRVAAAEALGNIGKGARPALLPLLRATRDPNPAVRAAVNDTLRKVGAPSKENASQLLALWQEPVPEKREAYATSIRMLRPDAETSAILFVPLLNDAQKKIRLQAIATLGDAGPSVRGQTFSKLLPLLDDADKDVRTRTLAALGKLGPPQRGDRPELEAGLRAKSREMRLFCVQQIGVLGPEALASLPFVARLLGDAEASVRLAAARALGQFGKACAEVVDEILKARTDSEPGVRKESIAVLGLVAREKGVLAALLDSLNDADQEVQDAAAKAIRAAQPPLGKGDLSLLVGNLRDKKAAVRRFCAAELARIGADCAPVLQELLTNAKDPDPVVRGNVFVALGALGPAAKNAVPALVETMNAILIDDGRGAGALELFRQASIALGKIASPDVAVPVWRSGLQTKNKALRKEIAQSLAAVGEPARKAVPELCGLLGDPDAGETAAETLKKLGGPDVVKELGRVVDKGTQPAKLAAIRLLSKMGPDAKPALGPLYEALRVYRGKEIGDAALEAVRRIDRKP